MNLFMQDRLAALIEVGKFLCVQYYLLIERLFCNLPDTNNEFPKVNFIIYEDDTATIEFGKCGNICH